MNQSDQISTNNTPPPPRTSIGIKLPLIMIGLMLFAFLVYTYISIQISQGSRTNNIKEELQAETSDNVKIIQSILKEFLIWFSSRNHFIQSKHYMAAI